MQNVHNSTVVVVVVVDNMDTLWFPLRRLAVRRTRYVEHMPLKISGAIFNQSPIILLLQHKNIYMYVDTYIHLYTNPRQEVVVDLTPICI